MTHTQRLHRAARRWSYRYQRADKGDLWAKIVMVISVTFVALCILITLRDWLQLIAYIMAVVLLIGLGYLVKVKTDV